MFASAEASRSARWLAAAAFADGPSAGFYGAGAPGWSNSSTRALSRQIPSMAASTTSVGSIYSASTFQVDDGAQCGGTGGEPEPCMLTPDNEHNMCGSSTLPCCGISLPAPCLSFICLRSWELLTTPCNVLTPRGRGRPHVSRQSQHHLQGSALQGIAASRPDPAFPAPGRLRCAPN